jgi:hypothetical protein
MVDISAVQIKPSLHYPISERRYAVDQSRYHADTCDLSNSANERAYDVRYWHLADIPSCTAHVRFWGKSGHKNSWRPFQISAQSIRRDLRTAII